MSRLLLFFVTSLMLFLVFFYGVGVGKYEWFPHSEIKKVKRFIVFGNAKIDKYGRLISSPSHIEIECPNQTESTGVLFAFGQSNSANSAEYKVPKSELKNIINYFEGKCFEAQSPLLGASGIHGEWISMTAKKLIDNGLYEKVIVISSGIDGARIERWAEGNDLNAMLVDVLDDLLTSYKPTDLVWHQGESDLGNTHSVVYEAYFSSLLRTIKNLGIIAPIFISTASICGAENTWVYPNKISRAQASIIKRQGIKAGVNTDVFVPLGLRYDNCHFTKQGQEIASNILAQKINRYHTGN